MRTFAKSGPKHFYTDNRIKKIFGIENAVINKNVYYTTVWMYFYAVSTVYPIHCF